MLYYKLLITILILYSLPYWYLFYDFLSWMHLVHEKKMINLDT